MRYMGEAQGKAAGVEVFVADDGLLLIQTVDPIERFDFTVAVFDFVEDVDRLIAVLQEAREAMVTK
jgi:hypothetical protein